MCYKCALDLLIGISNLLNLSQFSDIVKRSLDLHRISKPLLLG